MTVMLKKLQQKYARVRDEMMRWDALQSQLLSQFGNASSIIIRLQVLNENKNYDSLEVLPGIKETLLGKQIEMLEMIFISMKDTMKEFHVIILSFDKIARDADQLLRGSTPFQMQLCVGIQPSLQQCLDGLQTFYKMHKSEFLLKSSIIASLMLKYFKCSANDVAALRQLLVDQPNIPKDEVQTIFDIILPKVAAEGLTAETAKANTNSDISSSKSQIYWNESPMIFLEAAMAFNLNPDFARNYFRRRRHNLCHNRSPFELDGLRLGFGLYHLHKACSDRSDLLSNY